MQITNIVQAKKDQERVNIFIDTEFVFSLDKNTLVEFRLFQGQQVDQMLVKAVQEHDQQEYLYRRLVEWWLLRPRGPRELRQKLKLLLQKRDQEASTEVVERVMDRLQASGYTAENFANWFAEQRSQQQKYGPKKVQAELIAKGVSATIARQVVTRYFTDAAAREAQLLQKKFGVSELKEISDPRLKAKAYRWLKSRGF